MFTYGSVILLSVLIIWDAVPECRQRPRPLISLTRSLPGRVTGEASPSWQCCSHMVCSWVSQHRPPMCLEPSLLGRFTGEVFPSKQCSEPLWPSQNSKITYYTQGKQTSRPHKLRRLWVTQAPADLARLSKPWVSYEKASSRSYKTPADLIGSGGPWVSQAPAPLKYIRGT